MTVYTESADARALQTQAMSDGYWKRWNPDVQARIDRDIEAHRKADGCFRIAGVPAGTEVRVEQVSHAFVFGTHLFNFNQLGTDERNRRHQELFGTLFNAATIPFYWAPFEPEEGKPRFEMTDRDTAEFWNTVKEPMLEPHWRRPATDPLVEFCERKGIRRHGHTLVWGSQRWQFPLWLLAKLPEPYRSQALAARKPGPHGISNSELSLFADLSAEQIKALVPEFTRILNVAMAERIMRIALRYKGRLHSWDVVNESAGDFGKGVMVPGSGYAKSWYGPMPGDYTYRAFKIADGIFPKHVQLAINDFNLSDEYLNQVLDLQRRGCKVDLMGAQMHLFNPQSCLDIADGKSDVQSPESVWKTMQLLGRAKLPIHLSEITITAPHNDTRGQAIQAVIARNLYRLWFSIKPMMGITWWNVVDGCGAPGEPAVSGIFSRDMQPKPAYFALNDLINRDWKTRTVVKTEKDGAVCFRGFRGSYRLSWRDAGGQEVSQVVELE